MLRTKEILKSKGVSQKRLASDMNISEVGLSKILNGNPTIETLDKIAKALDVDVRDLFKPTKAESKEGETIFVYRNGKYEPIGQLF